MRLFHYSCDHALDGIRDAGYMLRPWGVPGHPQLVWLTDLDQPDRNGLGLTMRLTKCDRTRWRYEATQPLDDTIQPWSQARSAFRPTYVESLEKTPGAQPDHWWISRNPVHVSPPEHVDATPPAGWHRLTLTEMAAHTDGELHGMTKTGTLVGASDGNGWWRRNA